MNDQLDIIAESGFQFFGKMTASISHEIKNVLAIINENAGLLEDLALIAEQGLAIDAQRLKALSHSVMKQVKRADMIVKNMNRFGRSADASFQTIDLNVLIELLVALSNRSAAMRGITLKPKFNESPVTIKTSPFLLMNLLWLCLEFAMDAAGDKKVVELASRKAEAAIRIRFSGSGGPAGLVLQTFPAEREKGLLGLLEAEMEFNSQSREIIVKLSGEV